MIRYSEAVRLAGTMYRQFFGSDGVGEYACANRGAKLVCGKEALFMPQVFPVAREMVSCPVCGEREELACVVAACLNDRHRWSFSQIADFIATIEPPESAEAPAAAAEIGVLAR